MKARKKENEDANEKSSSECRSALANKPRNFADKTLFISDIGCYLGRLIDRNDGRTDNDRAAAERFDRVPQSAYLATYTR